jgi:ribosomal protein S18 acetylase RimI-like enzyme
MIIKPMDTVKDRYYIYNNNEVVGVLEYVIYDNEIEIKYIKIHKEYRRMGIATKVINELKTKDNYIIGDALPEAIEFWKSLGAIFDEPFDNYDTVLTPFTIL